MNLEDIRIYCLSLPLASEDMPFDDTTLVFRVFGRIFCLLSLDGSDWCALKCEPEYAIELRERHRDIEPAFHMNKRHWNQINISGELSREFIQALIRHSYSQVVRKLARRIKDQNPILATVE